MVEIIKTNLKLSWNFNPINSLVALNDPKILFGVILLIILIMLFVLKYDKEFKLRLSRNKDLPKEDGGFEYGSSRWLTKKEIKKEFQVWDIGKKLNKGGIPVTYQNGKYYYSDSFDHTFANSSNSSILKLVLKRWG